jgi:hypothetical protein
MNVDPPKIDRDAILLASPARSRPQGRAHRRRSRDVARYSRS